MSNAEATEPEKKKRSKKAVILPVLVLVLGLGGGAFFFLSGSKSSSAAKNGASTTTTTMPGPIIPLNAITLNLSDGHVLKVGIALEVLAKPKDKEMQGVVEKIEASKAGGEGGSAAASSTASPMGGLESKALDLAISELGNKSFEELSAPGGRTAAKEELNKEISEAYHGDVVEIYFTNFVMS